MYTFQLRKGVTFHNGEPFNSAVAKWNIERGAAEGTKIAHPEFFRIIEKIETPFETSQFRIFSSGSRPITTAILITSILGPSMVNAMLAIGIFYIPVFARLTRAVAMVVWEKELVAAACACGISELGITRRHVLPNILSPLLIQGTIPFAVAILAEAGLSYLGLGTQPPHASCGRMLNEAQTFMDTNPWMATFPAWPLPGRCSGSICSATGCGTHWILEW